MDFDTFTAHSNVLMPLPGSLVSMVCKKCTWNGFAKKPGKSLEGETFPAPKCPHCGRRSLIENKYVFYS